MMRDAESIGRPLPSDRRPDDVPTFCSALVLNSGAMNVDDPAWIQRLSVASKEQ
jgi:hypothetical protein